MTLRRDRPIRLCGAEDSPRNSRQLICQPNGNYLAVRLLFKLRQPRSEPVTSPVDVLNDASGAINEQSSQIAAIATLTDSKKLRSVAISMMAHLVWGGGEATIMPRAPRAGGPSHNFGQALG